MRRTLGAVLPGGVCPGALREPLAGVHGHPVPIPQPPAASLAHGPPRRAAERSEARPGAPPGSASPGLVNTVTSQPWVPPGVSRQTVEVTHPDGRKELILKAVSEWQNWAYIQQHHGEAFASFNAWWATQMRLHKMRRRTLTRSRVQTQKVEALWPDAVCDFLTATYAPGDQWSPKHIAARMHCYRKQADRDGLPFRYEWVAELQLKRMRRRGESARECLHYHALIWHPANYTFPKPDSRGWWTHGMTNVESARNPVGYLSKYASKGTEGEALPRGARISGGGGLEETGRREVRWWLLPRYVRSVFPEVGSAVRRARGGGWVNWDDGEFLPAIKEW